MQDSFPLLRVQIVEDWVGLHLKETVTVGGCASPCRSAAASGCKHPILSERDFGESAGTRGSIELPPMPKNPPSAPSAEAAKPSPPSAELLARYAREFNKSSTLRYFGVQIGFPDQRTIEARVDKIIAEHRGGLGTSAVNGGVLAAIFDLVIGCTSALFDPTRRSATMQLSMSFERPVFGDSLRAEGRIDSAGNSVLFSSARLFDGAGLECARCQGLVRVSRLPWALGQSPAVDGQT